MCTNPQTLTRSWVLQHIAKAHFENNDYRKAEEVMTVCVRVWVVGCVRVRDLCI